MNAPDPAAANGLGLLYRSAAQYTVRALGDVDDSRAVASIADDRWFRLGVDAMRAIDAAELADPRLGAATTRQLLDELRARGECGGDPMGHLMGITAGRLMETLPAAVLDYRAVGSD